MFHYALFAWKTSPELPSGVRGFTYHHKNGYTGIAAIFIFLIAIETVALHLLVMHWSTALAWILSSLSVYGIFFLLGDMNAAKNRPIFIEEDTLVLRIGTRWRIRIPFRDIASYQ